MDFWTPYTSEAPVLSPIFYSLIIFVLLVLIYLSVKLYQHHLYSYLFKALQVIQLIVLYGWYSFYAFPWSESLPLYHCRLAMFALLFLSNQTNYKQYFALLGVVGSICALVYPYQFPHVTMFTYLLGHYALLVNSLVYLLNDSNRHQLGRGQIFRLTFEINLFLVFVNQNLYSQYHNDFKIRLM